MKTIIIILLSLVFIIKCHQEVKEIDSFLNLSSKLLEDLPKVRNTNFDIRERKFKLAVPFDAQEYEPKTGGTLTCGSNPFLQLSSIITEKIFKRADLNPISPMNSITCYKKGFSCDKIYENKQELIDDLNLAINFYNENGAQYLSNYKYSFNKDGTFEECKKFENEIEFFKTNRFEMSLIVKDLDTMKKEIYYNGSILVIYQYSNKFFRYTSGIYEEDKESEKVGYTVLKVIGWRTLNNKLYWIFSYTKNGFGINNFGMMEDKSEYNFDYFSIKYKEADLNQQ